MAENGRATPKNVNGRVRVGTWAYVGCQPEVDNVRRARRRDILGDGTEVGDCRKVARMGVAARANVARYAPTEETASVFKAAIGNKVCSG